MGTESKIAPGDLPLSVVMPVYNAEKYVRNAIDSILSQSFGYFEFIIIDDGSCDQSREIIDAFPDSRIRVVRNERNIGVARSLNKGLSIAKGKYIARMDADDISMTDRFARQLDFMESSPSVDICGSWVWRADGQKKYVLRYPVGNDCISSFLLFGNPLAHPSVIMRRDALKKHHLEYDPDCAAAQDYELWSRCWGHCGLDNIPEPLIEWRFNQNSVTNSSFTKSNETSLNVLRRMIAVLDIELDEKKLLFHREVGNGSGVYSADELTDVARWLDYLIHINHSRRIFSQEGFCRAASFAWFRVCLNSSGLGVHVLKEYLQSSLRRWYRPGTRELLYLLMNSFVKFNKQPTGRVRS